ncbi:MAG: hypothetical protein V4547_00745 [Bacteroidota bacterium]
MKTKEHISIPLDAGSKEMTNNSSKYGSFDCITKSKSALENKEFNNTGVKPYQIIILTIIN